MTHAAHAQKKHPLYTTYVVVCRWIVKGPQRDLHYWCRAQLAGTVTRSPDRWLPLILPILPCDQYQVVSSSNHQDQSPSRRGGCPRCCCRCDQQAQRWSVLCVWMCMDVCIAWRGRGGYDMRCAAMLHPHSRHAYSHTHTHTHPHTCCCCCIVGQPRTLGLA